MSYGLLAMLGFGSGRGLVWGRRNLPLPVKSQLLQRSKFHHSAPKIPSLQTCTLLAALPQSSAPSLLPLTSCLSGTSPILSSEPTAAKDALPPKELSPDALLLSAKKRSLRINHLRKPLFPQPLALQALIFAQSLSELPFALHLQREMYSRKLLSASQVSVCVGNPMPTQLVVLQGLRQAS